MRRTALFCAAALSAACSGPGAPTDYRREMRSLVREIDRYAEARRPGFRVYAQNGLPLLTEDGTPSGPLARDYASALDGVAQESLFHGHGRGRTPEEETRDLGAFLDRARGAGLDALVTDYPSDAEAEADSYRRNALKGYRSLAAKKLLDEVPASRPGGPVPGFLYLINPRRFSGRAEYLEALRRAPQPLLIIDLFFGGEALTRDEVLSLKTGPDGKSRPVLSYMSIGEAEEYRYYWKPGFRRAPPAWLEAENPEWEGNHKVRYWDPAWKRLLFGGADAYLDRVLSAGFDGVYLDLIDAYAYFEGKESSAR